MEEEKFQVWEKRRFNMEEKELRMGEADIF